LKRNAAARSVASAAEPPPFRRLRFQTETGSVYEIVADATGMRWHRTPGLGSGVLRSEEGVLVAWPDVRLGSGCVLLCEPYAPPFPRLVVTSIVVGVLV
jgi:hypothetical protein